MAARRRVRISRHPHTCQRVRGGANSVVRQVQTARAAAQPSRHPRPRLGRCNHNRPCLRRGCEAPELVTFATAGPGKRAREGQTGTDCTKGPRQTPRFVSFLANHPPTGVGQLQPTRKKTKGHASAPAEHHVRAALREEGIGSVLSRFKRFFSLVSLGRRKPLHTAQHLHLGHPFPRPSTRALYYSEYAPPDARLRADPPSCSGPTFLRLLELNLLHASRRRSDHAIRSERRAVYSRLSAS